MLLFSGVWPSLCLNINYIPEGKRVFVRFGLIHRCVLYTVDLRNWLIFFTYIDNVPSCNMHPYIHVHRLLALVILCPSSILTRSKQGVPHGKDNAVSLKGTFQSYMHIHFTNSFELYKKCYTCIIEKTPQKKLQSTASNLREALVLEVNRNPDYFWHKTLVLTGGVDGLILKWQFERWHVIYSWQENKREWNFF